MLINPDDFPLKVRELLHPIVTVSKPPKQGMYSQVIFAESGLGSVVIKRSVGDRMEALRRESSVLNSLEGIDLPIPEALLFLKSPRTNEGWLVMRRLPGEPLEFLLRSKELGPARAQLIHNLGRTISRLHDKTFTPPLLPGGSNWLDEMLQQAGDNLKKGIGEGSRELFEQLRNSRPDPVDPVLIHGDLFLDNVLSNGFEITGLIDWAFGAVGDPRYDITLATYGFSAADRKSFFEGYGKSVFISRKEYDYFQKLALFY